MKRTAKYETLGLNAGKWREIEEIARAYAEEKDQALALLGRAANGRLLDSKRDFRAAMKGSVTTLPAHLHDSALFDAADTMKRYIACAKAHTPIRAKVFARFDRAERHYAFWLLRRYERLGMALGGVAPGTGTGFCVCTADPLAMPT